MHLNLVSYHFVCIDIIVVSVLLFCRDSEYQLSWLTETPSGYFSLWSQKRVKNLSRKRKTWWYFPCLYAPDFYGYIYAIKLEKSSTKHWIIYLVAKHWYTRASRRGIKMSCIWIFDSFFLHHEFMTGNRNIFVVPLTAETERHFLYYPNWFAWYSLLPYSAG